MELKLGLWVHCSAYVKPSGNHYEITEAKGDEWPSCAYIEAGADEGVEIEEYHSCDRLKTIEAEFDALCVGETMLCTELAAELREDPYRGMFYQVTSEKPEKFAVVYYGNNRKRLVPIDRVAPIGEAGRCTNS